jgi:hypothetical protein
MTILETPAPASGRTTPNDLSPGRVAGSAETSSPPVSMPRASRRPNSGPATGPSTPSGTTPDRSTSAPDHTPIDTHEMPVGGGYTLHDFSLFLSAAQLDNIESLRIAVQNRHEVATRSEPDSDGQMRGFALDPADPAVVASGVLLDTLKATEHQATLTLRRQMRRHPIEPWRKVRVGVGEKQLARLLAAVGDPYINASTGQPRTVSALWAYCGLHTLPAPGQKFADTQVLRTGSGAQFPDGGQDGRGAQSTLAAVRTAARRQRGQQANWSSTAKMRAYLIAESCIKKSASPYRAVYDQGRVKYAEAVHAAPCPQCGPAGKPAPVGSSLRLGHQHARALRLVSKTILRDLWREARRLHEQHIKRCRHGHVCLVNAGRLLHPPSLDVCDLGAEGEVDD